MPSFTLPVKSKAKHWFTTDSLLDRVGEIVCAFPGISAAAITDEAFRFALASGALEFRSKNV